MVKKVFGIGLSKTGTTSLNEALILLGYKSKHYPIEMISLNDGKLSIDINEVNNYDALCDTPIALFYKELDEKFPNSKFILSMREIDDWLKSYRIHLGRFPKRSPKEMKLRLDLYGCNRFNTKKLKEAFINHLREVQQYFTDRPNDICTINICAGEGWDKLCDFLGKPKPNIPFPQKDITKYKRIKLILIHLKLFSAFKSIKDKLR